MSIRLYPNVEPAEMERLAGVPAGTYDRLTIYEAKRPVKDGPAMTAWYAGLFHDTDMNNLNSLKVFGWGRLTGKALAYVRAINENAGVIDNPSQTQALLFLQGITAEGVTSVRWS